MNAQPFIHVNRAIELLPCSEWSYRPECVCRMDNHDKRWSRDKLAIFTRTICPISFNVAIILIYYISTVNNTLLHTEQQNYGPVKVNLPPSTVLCNFLVFIRNYRREILAGENLIWAARLYQTQLRAKMCQLTSNRLSIPPGFHQFQYSTLEGERGIWDNI